METAIFFFLLFLILLPLINAAGKSRKREEKEIDNRIAEKEDYLISLEQRINNTSLDRGTGLTLTQINVLDKYERSNIRIPADILEELPHMSQLDESETLEYIEQQRQQWKLENGKKVFKK